MNTPAGVLVGKFKYRERCVDEDYAIEALEKLGAPIAGRVTQGAVEGGGTYLLDESTLVIGSGNRSTLRGIEMAADILRPQGIEVIPVESTVRLVA